MIDITQQITERYGMPLSRKFKLHKRYYGEDYDLYKKKTITINEGVTVLVGCNGAGKTTLLHQIKDQLIKDSIPVISFDNLREGGNHAISSAGFYGDYAFMGTAMASSEGENIVMNIGRLASNLRAFIKNGEVKGNSDALASKLAQALWGEQQPKEKEVPNERWLLLDAIDSGLSVDNIVDLKEYLFKTILSDAGDIKVYILVSGNEYEIARGENCFDVYQGKYIKFSNYERYRNFILKSRQIKDQRYEELN
jgi:energy-coupling factor transporter ATP-binding protein EcfA2